MLSIALGVRNYVSLDCFPTKKRVNSLIYYLSKIKKQIVILDVIHAHVAESNEDFVVKKVKRTALKTIKTLDASNENQDFLRDFKDIEDSRYRNKVREAKDKILDSIRKRVFWETENANLLGSKKEKR